MKRYNFESVITVLWNKYTTEADVEISESPDGEWVKWEDVEPYLHALLKLKISLGDISVAVDNVGWCNLSNIWDEIKSMGIKDE